MRMLREEKSPCMHTYTCTHCMHMHMRVMPRHARRAKNPVDGRRQEEKREVAHVVLVLPPRAGPRRASRELARRLVGPTSY